MPEDQIDLTDSQKRAVARLFLRNLQKLRINDPSYDLGYEDALYEAAEKMGIDIIPMARSSPDL